MLPARSGIVPTAWFRGDLLAIFSFFFIQRLASLLQINSESAGADAHVFVVWVCRHYFVALAACEVAMLPAFRVRNKCCFVFVRKNDVRHVLISAFKSCAAKLARVLAFVAHR